MLKAAEWIKEAEMLVCSVHCCTPSAKSSARNSNSTEEALHTFAEYMNE